MKHDIVKHGIDVGDLVKMKHVPSPLGIAIEIQETNLGTWVRIMWPDNEDINIKRWS